MTAPPPPRSKNGSRLVAALVLAGCAGVVVLAASHASHDVVPTLDAGATDVTASSSAAPGLDGAPPRSPSDAGARAVADPLGHFRNALTELTKHARRAHVHVAFFGDSHAQGEMWTGGLRRRLQERFGDGGPGFAFAGSPRHRNDALRIETTGAWSIEPRQPSTTTPFEDGKLGLGGVLTSPEHTGRVELSPRATTEGAMAWDVCSWSKGAHDRVALSGDGLDRTEARGNASAFVHTIVRTHAPNHLTLEVDGASLCGVVGERDPKVLPGVVLDALGINGARYRTMLAWNADAFVEELARRSPDLVILEYGTNEEGDVPPHVEDVGHDLDAAVDRIRRAAPEASCLVLGPTERNDRVDATTDLDDALSRAADRNGCAFWDTFRTMGGRGSMRAWQTQSPELAQRDGVHLTADGYEKLAALLFEDITRDVERAGP